MISRRGTIISAANSESTLLINSIPEDRPRTRENFEAVQKICRELIQRRQGVPIKPTARIVAEEGKNVDPAFPAVQTIYNTYNEMIGIWRRAYHRIVVIDSPDPMSGDQLLAMDLSGFDHGVRGLLEEMRRFCQEKWQENNVLRRFHRETSKTSNSGQSVDHLVLQLEAWLRYVSSSGFRVPDEGLRVTRKTPIGTLVMEQGLLDGLAAFVADHRQRKKGDELI